MYEHHAKASAVHDHPVPSGVEPKPARARAGRAPNTRPDALIDMNFIVRDQTRTITKPQRACSMQLRGFTRGYVSADYLRSSRDSHQAGSSFAATIRSLSGRSVSVRTTSNWGNHLALLQAKDVKHHAKSRLL